MVDNEGNNDHSEYIETVNLGSLCATNNNQTDKGSACKVDVHKVAEIEAELKVAGKSIIFVVVTAASVTVISDAQFDKRLAHITLNKTDVKLKSYCNSSIPALGCADVNVDYEGNKYKLPQVVVGGSIVASLGHNWLKYIKLNWKD